MELLHDEDMRRVLLEIDEEASLEMGVPEQPFKVIVVGGSALMLSGITSRKFTRDIDLVEFDSRLQEIIARHPEVNSAAFYYEGNLPDGWDERLVPLALDTKAVAYCRPSLEDLVVMKLYALRDQDLDDLESPELLSRIDWAKLDSLVADEKGADINLVSKRVYGEMVHAYEIYKERMQCPEE